MIEEIGSLFCHFFVHYTIFYYLMSYNIATFYKPSTLSINLYKNIILLSKGPSINDVTHVLRFFTPPSPLSPILLNMHRRRTRGCSRCTPTFTQSPKVYSIKWGENSPSWPCSAPALFRALRRQCK